MLGWVVCSQSLNDLNCRFAALVFSNWWLYCDDSGFVGKAWSSSFFSFNVFWRYPNFTKSTLHHVTTAQVGFLTQVTSGIPKFFGPCRGPSSGPHREDLLFFLCCCGPELHNSSPGKRSTFLSSTKRRSSDWIQEWSMINSNPLEKTDCMNHEIQSLRWFVLGFLGHLAYLFLCIWWMSSMPHILSVLNRLPPRTLG